MSNVTDVKKEEDFTESEGLCVVDFYGTWCPPCKALMPILDEFSKNNKDVKIVKVNIDDHGPMALKYNVMAVPTLMLFKDGKSIKTAQGFLTKEKLEEFAKE